MKKVAKKATKKVAKKATKKVAKKATKKVAKKAAKKVTADIIIAKYRIAEEGAYPPKNIPIVNDDKKTKKKK